MSDKPHLIQITEAVIEPLWNVGVLSLGAESIPYITLNHPRHGPLHTLVAPATARQLVGMLTTAVETAEAAAAPPLPTAH